MLVDADVEYAFAARKESLTPRTVFAQFSFSARCTFGKTYITHSCLQETFSRIKCTFRSGNLTSSTRRLRSGYNPKVLVLLKDLGFSAFLFPGC